MAQKSETKIIALDVCDPASNEGMIKVATNLARFVPVSPDGISQKTTVHGDQNFVERGKEFENLQNLKWGNQIFLETIEIVKLVKLFYASSASKKNKATSCRSWAPSTNPPYI